MAADPWYVTAGEDTSIPGYATGANSQFLDSLAAEQRRQWDASYGLQKQQLDQQYKIAQLNAKSASERNAIDKWYQEQQVQLAQARLAEDQRQFNTNTGYNLVSTLAGLKGPANYWAASNYSRGVAAMPGTPAFLAALQSNTSLVPSSFGAQAGSPSPESYGTLLAKLGGDPSGGTGTSGGTSTNQALAGLSAAPGGSAALGTAPSGAAVTGAGGGANAGVTQHDAALASIKAIGARGAQGLIPGSLEALSPTELELFTSGLDAAGFDSPTFLKQYASSRVGNNYGLGKAA